MLERTRVKLAWTLCLVLAAVGCSDDGPRSGNHPRPVERTPGETPPADQPSNGTVELDEAGLHGVVRDGELELSIPVRALEPGNGSVRAELIAVDRSKVEATAEVDYRLEADERRTLTARLRLPDDVRDQADRVAYSVRVRDRTSSLLITRSLLYVLSPFELRLEGPSALQASKQGSYRVRAQHPITREPLAGVPVSLAVTREGTEVVTLAGETDDARRSSR